jgi:ATP synthase F1 gamma subunit
MALAKHEVEIESLESLKLLVQTYEEIAANRMQKVKKSVLNNRDFLASLYKIYQHVKYSYEHELSKLKKKKGTAGDSVISRNGKTLSMLLSANTGLYGDIINRTYRLFVEGLSEGTTDVAVVGKVGRSLIERDKVKLGIDKYKYFELSDDALSADRLASLTSHVVEYEKIVVYHGQFVSVIQQKPIKESVTGDIPQGQAQTVEEARYIFEPSLKDIMKYFESEIMASVFEQTLHESSLSKYASRMINLDKAVVNVQESLAKAHFEKQRMHHRVMNKKQLGVLSSISLWG